MRLSNKYWMFTGREHVPDGLFAKNTCWLLAGEGGHGLGVQGECR